MNLFKFFRNIGRGIKNIIRYWKVIWNDRDWDDYYIYKLLQTKLRFMEQFFRSDKCYREDKEKTADQIKFAIKKLDRLIKNVYLDEAFESFFEKYPDFEWKPKFEPIEDMPRHYKYISCFNEEQKELAKECFKKADELENQDYEELFEHLKKYIRDWWD